MVAGLADDTVTASGFGGTAAWGAQVPVTPRARTDLLNVCMDAKHHKGKTGPRDSLRAGEDGVGSGVGEREDPQKGRS